MELIDIIVSFIVGVVSGIASGVIVSNYYKNKEAEEKFKKELHEDKQNLVRFLQAIQLELEIIMKAIDNNEKPKLEDIRRKIADQPRTRSFASEKISEVSVSRIHTKNEIMKEVKENIDTGELDKKTLILLDRKLFRAQVEVLQIVAVKD